MDTTILVIEESLDLCRLFEYMLRADGHTVFSFNDWHAARPALIAYAPDLIIFDWSIANMAGYRWAESLRRAPDTAHIPILFVCSDPPSRATSEMIASAGIALIEKPFDIFIFRNRVAALLGTRERTAGA